MKTKLGEACLEQTINELAKTNILRCSVYAPAKSLLDYYKKFGITEEIIAPIQTHHEDRPNGLIAVIVKVADAISAARPGARRDTFEQYIQRLEELEKIATSIKMELGKTIDNNLILEQIIIQLQSILKSISR